MPKVFISHQQADSPAATRVAQRLKAHQIDTYLDVIDPTINGTGEALATYVRTQLGRCTQLLAVVSSSTRLSWWVPWEIGIATEKDFPLATYLSDASLPEYLRKWPVLRNDQDLDAYAQASKSAQVLFESKRRVETASDAQRSSTQQFYRDLRTRLGQ